MNEVLVAMPFAAGDLAELPGRRSIVGYTPTPELKATFGLSGPAEDEADRAALVVASVAALSRWGQRRVATALVGPGQLNPGADSAHGEVLVNDLSAGQVVAWFADAPDLDHQPAAGAAAGLGIDEAWDTPEVAALISHDLLWHDASESESESESESDSATAEARED